MKEHLHSYAKLEFAKVLEHIRRHAASEIGREHIDNLVPSSDLLWIRQQLDAVTEMKRLITSDEPFPIAALQDIRRSVHRARIEEYVLPPEELTSIHASLVTSRKIKAYFTRREEAYPILFQLVQRIVFEKILEYNIAEAVDEEGRVRDSASKELGRIRREAADRSASLRKQLERILKGVADKDWIQEEIITTREGRMVIPVKAEHKNRVPGFIHSSSASGATVFVEPTETLDLNNDLRTLQFEEQREIHRILRGLTKEVAEHADALLQSFSVYGEFDFLYAKAQYSIEILGNSPFISAEGRLSLSNAYHPILLHRHARKDIVPLSLSIGEDLVTIIITGPNAGGKSVAMKTVGLLTILALAGLHIPASPDSVVRVFTDIFVEVGDDQSIEDDLSSFSSHLTNLREIVVNANAGSLILIDEIGSGTDPAEGASIAAAILEYLTQRNAISIITTHHGVLKSFAYETPGVQNCAMEFDQETLTPTYRLRVGVPGSSYALEMAERLALPQAILDRAKELRGTESMKLENLIEDLERKNQETSARLQSVSEEKEKYEGLNQLYQTKLNTLQTELKSVKAKALVEAQGIVERANVSIEKAVREIKEKSASSSVIREVREEIRSIEAEFRSMEHELRDGGTDTAQYAVGDFVKLKDSNSSGEITSQVDKDHYIVLAGDLRIKVKASQLEPGRRGQATKKLHQSIDYIREGKSEIDLRGLYGEEAIQSIEKFFDEAILAGLTRVSLIHGKGTGALRRKIEEYLKKHPTIKSYRLGEWNEGGGGVTVVELS